MEDTRARIGVSFFLSDASREQSNILRVNEDSCSDRFLETALISMPGVVFQPEGI